MKNVFQKDAIHKIIRLIELYTEKQSKVGVFTLNGKEHGIQLHRMNYNPDYGNLVSSVKLNIEIMTTSGLVYICIGEFSIVHPDCFINYVPQIRADKHWLSWDTNTLQCREKCVVSTNPTNMAGRRKSFSLSGKSPEEMVGELESEMFQYNLVCDNIDYVDELQCSEFFRFALEEFDAMYDGAKITGVGIVPLSIQVHSEVEEFYIPYDVIASEIEKYVLTENK